MSDYRISYLNINKIKFPRPQRFEHIRFDPNYNCNLHCVYCHNPRSKEEVREEDFVEFLETQVESIENFQLGCAMEPTLDKRLTKFALIVGKSRFKPPGMFRLQTNGILLHRHDPQLLKEAGVNFITVSVDSIRPEIHKELRGGSNLDKILRNVQALQDQWPAANVWFITTVNRLNLPGLPDLVSFACDNGIKGIELRHMFYIPDSRIIADHEKMKSLLISEPEFQSACEALQHEYSDRIFLYFNDSRRIADQKLSERT
jgi:MoaA/NifB/PqqE/SkfB family radical SAM enzyme